VEEMYDMLTHYEMKIPPGRVPGPHTIPLLTPT